MNVVVEADSYRVLTSMVEEGIGHTILPPSAIYAEVRGGRLEVEPEQPSSRRAVLGTCLAFTWLNPHVYLDTVLLLGSLAGTYGRTDRWWFAGGAGLGSIVWFTALGVGARALTPVFRRRLAWRVLDGAIAVVMVTLAGSLLLPMLTR